MRIGRALDPVVVPGHAAVVKMNALAASRDVVVLHDEIAAAAEHDRTAGVHDAVREQRLVAVAVVNVDAHREDVVRLAVGHRIAEVVDVVADDTVRLGREVAPRIDGAGIAGLADHVPDLIPRDEMILAIVDDRAVRRRVDAAATDFMGFAV